MLSSSLDILNFSHRPIIILGDFNVHECDWLGSPYEREVLLKDGLLFVVLFRNTFIIADISGTQCSSWQVATLLISVTQKLQISKL